MHRRLPPPPRNGSLSSSYMAYATFTVQLWKQATQKLTVYPPPPRFVSCGIDSNPAVPQPLRSTCSAHLNSDVTLKYFYVLSFFRAHTPDHKSASVLSRRVYLYFLICCTLELSPSFCVRLCVCVCVCGVCVCVCVCVCVRVRHLVRVCVCLNIAKISYCINVPHKFLSPNLKIGKFPQGNLKMRKLV